MSKLITRSKPVLVVNLTEQDIEAEFTKLSDIVYELCRGLYRYVDNGQYYVYNREFTNEQIFQEFDLHTPLREREADEVWVFGSEAGNAMGGTKPFWIGDHPVKGTDNIYRRFSVMRLGDFPLKTFAQRVENTLYYLYRGYPPRKNAWEKYLRDYGTILRPPNSILGGYSAPDEFYFEDWAKSYPVYRGQAGRFISSDEWGRTEEGYLKWWLGHLPHGVHKTDGIHDNWWHYIMNLDLVR